MPQVPQGLCPLVVISDSVRFRKFLINNVAKSAIARARAASFKNAEIARDDVDEAEDGATNGRGSCPSIRPLSSSVSEQQLQCAESLVWVRGCVDILLSKEWHRFGSE